MIRMRMRALCALLATMAIGSVSAGDPLERFPALTDAEAWARMPAPTSGKSGVPLPHWARVLAARLPKTAAALLQLDHAQRTASPVEPRLRAAMRWVAADANGSVYGKACALADGRSAGLNEDMIQALAAEGYPGWSEPERAALTFARKMSVASDQVSDTEFDTLVKHFGTHQAASMVLAMAYANFMDRLTICLGSMPEPDGPPKPVSVTFDRDSLATGKAATAKKPTNTTPRKIEDLPPPTGQDLVGDDAEWTAETYETLQKLLEIQKKKPTRLPIPSWSEVEKNLPAGLMKRPSDIVWYRITFGYAPELAVPFEVFMRTAGGEGGPHWDRVFGSSLFWVTTKAMKCPYCMGHCEMNWEVAGLTVRQIADRSRLLSGDDWSSFPPEQQHAFAFARKMTRDPSSIDDADISGLKEGFGPLGALLVVLNGTRYHYMTRISNGFQLKLEDENVFYDYYDVKPGTRAGMAVVPLTDAEAWEKMPKALSGSGQPLPMWARAVARQMPRTAAAMLEADLAHRTKSPLPPRLRAKMRWVVADANRCDYGKAYALADLRREGGTEAEIQALSDGPDAWNDDDRAALSFARVLSVDAPSLDDDLFDLLRSRHGDHGVAAMVLLAAFGNFQDRIVLGLKLPLEEGGPLPPVPVKFEPVAFQSRPVLPQGDAKSSRVENGATVVPADEEWDDLSFDTLQARLESQRSAVPRLPVPSWDDVKKKLPPEFASRPTRIVWNLVCSGYVPELAVPWSVSTRTMWAEAGQDRIFEECLFWVQTRAIRCNYCMGHCEMLLEVAGLKKDEIAERTRSLASDDWSSFPPEQQRAFAYARKLTKTPWELTRGDYLTLEKDFGEKPAMAIFWWLCRGLYMTRVSDGFRLPLERENVFADFFGKSVTNQSPSQSDSTPR